MGWLFHALLSSDTYHHPGMDCTWGSKEEQRRLGLPVYDSTTSRGAEGAAPAGNVAIMCRKDHYAGGTGSQSPAGYVAHANAEWRHECWRELYLLMGFHMLPALFEIIMAGSMFGYLPGSYASVLSDAGWDSSSILIRPPSETPLLRKPDSYPHVTNGGEKPDERPEASVCKESQPFQMVRQPGGPSWERGRRATQACHFRPKRTHRHGSRRVSRALGQHGQHQRINHRIGRTLWVFTRGRTNLRTAARQEATTDPSLRIRPSTGGPCRSSMRQPLVRH